LGVSNIRVLKRIERLFQLARPILESFDPKITRQAAQTLSLFGFCEFSKGEEVPSLEFVKGQRVGLYGVRRPKSEQNDQERKWESLLDKYQFMAMDEFDAALLQGVEHGYFDEDALRNAAASRDKSIKASAREGSFSDAWRLFHDSLDNNEAELVAALTRSFEAAVGEITPINLDGTVRLLRDLGKNTEADSLVSKYIDKHRDERDLFDLSQYPFRNDIKDPLVIEEFKKQFGSYKDERDPADVLLRIAKNHSWSNADISLLAKLSLDQFYHIFKKAGKNTNRLIGACQTFSGIHQPTEDMKMLSSTAQMALEKIAAESTLNELRMKRYGIEKPKI
jgi:hypothetical protein